jgi:hypothetical protein
MELVVYLVLRCRHTAGSNLQYLLTSSEPSQDHQHTQRNKKVLAAKGQSLDTFVARSIVFSSTDCVKQQCQRKKVIVGSEQSRGILMLTTCWRDRVHI